MRTLSVLLVLISCFSKGFCQHFNPYDYNGYVGQRFDITAYSASDLFDSCEIKNRKIKSASLLQVYDNTGGRDTLYIYYFDSTGKAVTQISFTPPSLDADGDSYVRDKVSDLNAVIPETNLFGKDVYTVIHYTPYGTERKSYNGRSGEMMDSEFIITCNFGDGYLQTNGRSEMIAYRLEEGSNLIGRIVSIQLEEDYFATQFVINYSEK